MTPSIACSRNNRPNADARALLPISTSQVRRERLNRHAQTRFSSDTSRMRSAHSSVCQMSGYKLPWAACLQARQSQRAKPLGAAGWLRRWHRQTGFHRGRHVRSIIRRSQGERVLMRTKGRLCSPERQRITTMHNGIFAGLSQITAVSSSQRCTAQDQLNLTERSCESMQAVSMQQRGHCCLGGEA